MDKRKKESGHSFRRKKAKRDQEIAVLRRSMNKFVNPAQENRSPINENQSMGTSEFESGVDEAESSDDQSRNLTEIQSGDGQVMRVDTNLSTAEKEIDSMKTNEFQSSDTQIENQFESQNFSERASEKPVEPIVHDPFTWSNILTAHFREQIVQSGLPPIPNQRTNYPLNNGRSFNESIFYATHINGMHYKRE